MRLVVRSVVSLALVASGLTPWGSVAAQQQPIRGFPADALAEHSQREAVLRSTPDTARLREYLSIMSEEPHHAGSPGSRAVAEYALSKFREWGLNAEIEEFEALMPMPLTRRVELLSPGSYVARLEEPAIAEDKDSGDQNQLPTYNAYSADGDVTGELVFVNYGVPEDYEQLERMGIDVRGKIVIAKYGRSWRGIKPKVAAEHGALACIIYSDPEEDGYYVEDVYPKGPMRPEMGAQRGSVMDMPVHPGDPLTPGWGAKRGERKLDRSEARTLVPIPVLPISYGDARPLLEALGGEVAPNDDWKGALPITYHVGPGPARVRVHLEFDWQVRTLYNVVARIPGTSYDDQWVIHGNHHDAWVNGANDPTSGAVALMETARSFSELLKTGWRPRRTMVFALWDGEEWGLLGSTEWVEHHREDLTEKAVVYFNTDSYSRGVMSGAGSHSLESFVREVTRDVEHPESGASGLEAWLEDLLDDADNAEDSAKTNERGVRLGALGSGSDYTAFIDHLTIASLNLGYGGGQPAGVYHSIYDSYSHYTRFMDPGFVYGKSQAGAMGMALLRMLDAPLLPFSFVDAARTYGEYVDELEELVTEEHGEGRLDLTAVRQSVNRLAAAGEEFDATFAAVVSQGSAWLEGKRNQLRVINSEIFRTERELANSEGLPRREWFRHSIYAPGYYTGYGVKTMPGIREAVEQGDLDEAAQQVVLVANAINRLATRVEHVTQELSGL